MRRILSLFLILQLLLLLPGPARGETLICDADAPVYAMSDTLYGLFFEDINHAADGGLYAELLQNRSFEYEDLTRPSRYLVRPTGTTDRLSIQGIYSDRSLMVRSSSLPSFMPLQRTIWPFMGIPASYSVRIFSSALPANRLWSIMHRSSGLVVCTEMLMGAR